jgi:hypothetical protein
MKTKVIDYQSIKWYGSVSDLATDCANLLTPEQGIELINQLTSFLTKPHLQDKWCGRGFNEVES